MAFTLFSSGSKLRSSRLNEVASYAVPIQAEKASDTARTSTTTRTADPELSITLPANRTYDIAGLFLLTSAANAAGDFSYELAWTNTATVTLGGSGLNNALASGSSADLEGNSYTPDATTPTSAMPYGASTGNSGALMDARVVTGSSDVVLTVNWAQFTSNANSTTLRQGSKIVARRAL